MSTTVKIPLFVEIVGDTAVGKTHLSLTFPKPLLIDLTPKGEGLPIVLKLYPEEWLKRYIRVRSFGQIREAVKNAIRNPDYLTIIFDTSTDLRQLAAEEYLRETGKKSVYPVTEWRYVREKIDNLIYEIINAKKNLVFTSQLKDEYIDGKFTGRKVRDGYKKTPYFADIRIYLVLRKTDKGYKREGVILKNRFVDKASEEYVERIEDPSFEKIVEITKLPKEVLVL